jgi:hypothetical protein
VLPERIQTIRKDAPLAQETECGFTLARF